MRGSGQECGWGRKSAPCMDDHAAQHLTSFKPSQTIYSSPSLGSHVISEELHTTVREGWPDTLWPYLTFFLWESQQSICPALAVFWQTCTVELMKMVPVWPKDLSSVKQTLGCQKTKLRRQIWFILATNPCSLPITQSLHSAGQIEALPSTATPTSPLKITHKFKFKSSSKSTLSRSWSVPGTTIRNWGCAQPQTHKINSLASETSNLQCHWWCNHPGNLAFDKILLEWSNSQENTKGHFNYAQILNFPILLH